MVVRLVLRAVCTGGCDTHHLPSSELSMLQLPSVPPAVAGEETAPFAQG